MSGKTHAPIKIALIALLQLPVTGHAQSPVESAAGLWQSVDDATKEPMSWFLVSEHDGIYSAIIAKMFLKPGQDPNHICDQCKDDRHNHPWLGLEIVRGMKPDDENKYSGGTILDPRDGKEYKANMTLEDDGQTLVVRGYIGFSLLGKNVYWTRLPDTAYSMLDPSINPNTSPNPIPSTPMKQPIGAAGPQPRHAAPPTNVGH